VVDLLKKFISPSVRKRTFFFLILDVILIVFASFLAFLLRLEGAFVSLQYANLLLLIVVSPLVIIPILWALRLYWINWTYVGIADISKLFGGLSIAYFFVFLFVIVGRNAFLPNQFFTFPRSTIFIAFMLSLFFLGGARLSKRAYFHVVKDSVNGGDAKRKKILIVGAGDAGEQILRNILSQGFSEYKPAGFVDDNPFKARTSIHGYRVLGGIKDIQAVSEKYKIDGVIIALPSSGSREVKRAVERCREAGIRDIKILPSLSELLSSEVSLRDLREIRIEDLLGRDPVELNEAVLQGFIHKKRVFITGAAGSIGSELARQISGFEPSHVSLFDRDESALFFLQEELSSRFPRVSMSFSIGDIQNVRRMEYIMKESDPDIVFHSAAYKHVPIVEDHPGEGVQNNIYGTRVVAEAAVKQRVERFIFISTDKAVRPSSTMGKTKRVCEMLMQYFDENYSTEFISVRFGNVLGSQGSVIPIFQDQIKRGGPVTVTHPEMQRYFMSIPEAVLLVIQAGATGSGGGLYMLDMGKPVKIVDLAREMITMFGYTPDVDIPIVFTEPRPGEKLSEELFMNGKEELRPTPFPQILEVVAGETLDASLFARDLEELLLLADGNNQALLLEKLDSMI